MDESLQVTGAAVAMAVVHSFGRHVDDWRLGGVELRTRVR
jgi:hypothetical protein